MPAKRIANIIDHLTFEIYKYIQRGLFERHKLIFAWMMTAAVLVAAGKARPAPAAPLAAPRACPSRARRRAHALPALDAWRVAVAARV
jgi:hypothetical protein